MKKIPTYFERDWDGDRSRVVDQVHAGCEWVANGEGIATRKYDGMCVCIRDGQFLKRREVKKGKPLPDGFIVADEDDITGKVVGWVPVGDGPEDRYLREAYETTTSVFKVEDGTFEAVGPNIQGNPERWPQHQLVPHAFAQGMEDAPRTFDALRDWMAHQDIEGIVWHHPDGRMAKLKLRDFGLKRGD